MNRFPWIAQVYGYLVCIVAVVTFLINASGFVDAAFDRANPLQGRGGYYGPDGGSLTSFEAYRATQTQGRPTRVAPGVASGPESDTLTVEQQRARYEVLRADRISQTSFGAMQRLVKHGLLMLVAIVLFATHWRWLRRQREVPVT
jgi:hypothetical protein